MSDSTGWLTFDSTRGISDRKAKIGLLVHADRLAKLVIFSENVLSKCLAVTTTNLKDVATIFH